MRAPNHRGKLWRVQVCGRCRRPDAIPVGQEIVYGHDCAVPLCDSCWNSFERWARIFRPPAWNRTSLTLDMPYNPRDA